MLKVPRFLCKTKEINIIQNVHCAKSSTTTTTKNTYMLKHYIFYICSYGRIDVHLSVVAHASFRFNLAFASLEKLQQSFPRPISCVLSSLHLE